MGLAKVFGWLLGPGSALFRMPHIDSLALLPNPFPTSWLLLPSASDCPIKINPFSASSPGRWLVGPETLWTTMYPLSLSLEVETEILT
ncbi:hypothetical protein HYDPIDRAFT_113840 [Hydnomerulius pinastri MD-312]|uniref:Uncharacterized protein n=1 Tax=Hydnomerulius pinastri MD-312 TaxID=994086 RepID=A0A0C9W6X0_9AGAM|nr:hypothetical protein HYDPIDRAFT_113840 [Hydnomerulius pinastri MD-312]